jgi:hypothetical protein
MMLVFATSQDSQPSRNIPLTRYCSTILAFRNFLKRYINWCNCKDMTKTQLLYELHEKTCVRKISMNIATTISEKFAKFSPLVEKVEDTET